METSLVVYIANFQLSEHTFMENFWFFNLFVERFDSFWLILLKLHAVAEYYG